MFHKIGFGRSKSLEEANNIIEEIRYLNQKNLDKDLLKWCILQVEEGKHKKCRQVVWNTLVRIYDDLVAMNDTGSYKSLNVYSNNRLNEDLEDLEDLYVPGKNLKKESILLEQMQRPIIREQPIIRRTEQRPIIRRTEQRPIIRRTEQRPIIRRTEQRPIIRNYLQQIQRQFQPLINGFRRSRLGKRGKRKINLSPRRR
jgi:hypothetical protein